MPGELRLSALASLSRRAAVCTSCVPFRCHSFLCQVQNQQNPGINSLDTDSGLQQLSGINFPLPNPCSLFPTPAKICSSPFFIINNFDLMSLIYGRIKKRTSSTRFFSHLLPCRQNGSFIRFQIFQSNARPAHHAQNRIISYKRSHAHGLGKQNLNISQL